MECEDSLVQNTECDKNLLVICDSLFLQEYLLPDDQLLKLGQINRQFLSLGVSGFDNNEVLSGCSCGGLPYYGGPVCSYA
jgi:hypothetical protein